jgi:hypothetical protein
MRPLIHWILLPLLVLSALPCLAQEGKDARPPEKPKMDSLLVFGEGFALGVKEPEGWRSDTGEEAAKLHANVAFFPSAAGPGTGEVNIRVRVNDKADEDTVKDLQADIEGYRKEYPKIQLEEIPYRHAEYATFAKLFVQPGEFHEYTAYLNPGPQHPFNLSVTLSKGKSAATPAELAAYETVLKSLKVLGPQAPK